ncbi:MAG: BspA family leucine-rich repeat surface protein, partial [Bacilli bacterium]|nr:BspA family leucine-rich repeat surface protein [Bacilli bacterium]
RKFYMSRTTVFDLSSFNTSNVTNMAWMFAQFNNPPSLSSLNLSNFDTSNVTDMSNMFYYNSSLTNINLKTASFGKVTSYGSMFSGISNGITINTLNATTQSWLQARLSNAGKTGTVVITP